MEAKGAIGESKSRVVALGNFLMDTFRILGITDKGVITGSYVGRSNYYRMKRGGIINTDAYVRLSRYAVKKIREQVARHLLPNDFEERWRDRFCQVWLG